MPTDNTAIPVAKPMESIKFDNLLINFTTEFQRVWSTKGSGAELASFWRPSPAPDLLPGYFPLGDLAASADSNISGQRVMAVVCEGDPQSNEPHQQKAISRPDDYEQIWKSSDSGSSGAIWRPIPPDGYVALGLVCSNGHDKPSLNAVRCVRTDLVIASNVGDLIWNDKGSGAKVDFSAWSITPPNAEEGEIYFAPGTFIGANSYDKPFTHAAAYSLRMQIPLQINPAPQLPVLTGFSAPQPLETPAATQTARLPWFAVEDNFMLPIERFSKSPYYQLARTDQYVLIGEGHNTDEKSKLLRWSAPRTLIDKLLQVFTRITSIEVKSAWPTRVSEAGHPVTYSARLTKSFTHTEKSFSGWVKSQAIDIAAIIPKNRMLAVYQLHSRYDLLREDGTQAAVSFTYADSDGLDFAEYPREDNEVCAPAPVTGLPTATDNAP